MEHFALFMEHTKKEKKNNKRYLFIVIGIFLILVGIFVIGYREYSNNKNKLVEQEKIELFFEEEVNAPIEEPKQEEKQEELPKQVEPKKEINYVAILEIPKINLKKGLVDKNSKDNNVDKNIYTLKESTFPNDENNSHIILASHSGNSYISFFKNLKKLSLGDKVNLYYQNTKYEYEIKKKYEIEKTGTMTLNQTDTSDITFVTCISGTNKQLVFIAQLVNENSY